MGVRTKMSREDRAKQFMPFAALKGYPEALRKKEKIIVPKVEICEDYAEELDRKLKNIRQGDMITVIYYYHQEYIRKTGMVARIDKTAGILRIVNTKIPFADILDIRESRCN